MAGPTERESNDSGGLTVVNAVQVPLPLDLVREMIFEQFGLIVSVESLPGELDLNYRIKCESGRQFVFKVSPLSYGAERIDVQIQALVHLEAVQLAIEIPKVIRTKSGLDGFDFLSPSGYEMRGWMLSYVPGGVYAKCGLQDDRLLKSLGRSVAEVCRALQGFSHPALGRGSKWNLSEALWAADHLGAIRDLEARELCRKALEQFRATVVPKWSSLRHQAIHNDANDYNVLVTEGVVSGFIDFGDMTHTALVCDISIAAAYALMGHADPLLAACVLVAGYCEVLPLIESEVEVMWTMIQTRLAVSITNSSLQRTSGLDNEYLFVSEAAAISLIKAMSVVDSGHASLALKQAGGLFRTGLDENCCPSLIDKTLGVSVADLSVGSLDLGGGSTWSADERRAVIDRLRGSADVLVTKHLEASLFEVESIQVGEMPTIRLGCDLFPAREMDVLCPANGVVLSSDGRLVIGHESFYSAFYGLEASGLDVGSAIGAGQVLGVAHSEGCRVQFTIVHPGVDFPLWCMPSQADVYGEAMIDPYSFLDIKPIEIGCAGSLRERRDETFSRALSLSYSEPIDVARGFMQHLFDGDGRAYLDMVNNVAHVGHSNLRVVAAASRQLSVINTNTRYLHELHANYAEALRRVLPPSLTKFFFVNSGSEANELALRLARVATGGWGMVVVDAGYHGNTTSMIDVSPYKHDSPGGNGPPSWVEKVALPDRFRGAHRGEDAGPLFAEEIDVAVEALASRGEKLAGFLAESIVGCGGQVVVPPGYLASCFAKIRGYGGVCISDEVQIGFGRVGTHFWGFEQHDVVPDIVTMGKPIGNGWPLGCVATTAAIADTFCNGMEYFNTFGGSQASLATGLAVLEEIRSHDLQGNALRVGQRIIDGLRLMQADFECIGDVRGTGLFIGIEFVRGRGSFVPWADAASFVVNRARALGVLLSTDGPDHNVIKIKPPMVIDVDDADILLGVVRRALTEFVELD
jgi:4-aminobutyrate aminotransferase-like enzyme/Ser/Thr protein kinase RdoA (MazF antagonist)